MKLKALVLSIGSLLAGYAVADTGSTDINSQIQQLQQQISQLQSQINTVGTSNGGLGMLDQEVSRGVLTDYDQPFGQLPDSGLSYALLQQQSQFKSYLTLGGYIEGDAQYWGGSLPAGSVVGGTYNTPATDVALTTAKIYALANVNSWTQAFLTVKGGVAGGSTTFSEALLNFGNLSKNPLYATVGKTYLPYGVFAGNGPWANSLLTNAFRPSETNTLIFGFGQGGLNTSIGLFNGQNNLNGFVYGLQYGKTLNNWSLGGGGGYMNDIRYSGIGLGSDYATNGAAATSTSPLTGGRNGAVDINGSVAYNLGNNQSVGFNAEWDTTTSSPLYNNAATGKMSAWSATANYSLPIYGKNTTFALDYSQTRNMQNVPLPLAGDAQVSGGSPTPSVIGVRSQWLVFAQSEVYNNVYLGPEYARMKLYNSYSTWESTLDLSVYF